MSVSTARIPNCAAACVADLASRVVIAFLAIAAISTLIGCGMGATATGPAATVVSGRFNGGVHGGQQPVAGAKVYLYAASATNGGTAASLLNSPGFVLTDAGGNFSITGAYTCPANTMVYLLAVGGNPGLALGTQNASLAMMAGLGPCSSLTPSSFYTINEVTTVAAATSFASLATSTTQVGSGSGTNLVAAFQNIINLTDPTIGRARSVTPDGTGIVPQTKIDSLANSLAACINSDGSGKACTSLFTAATTASSTPSDTFQAALNIAKQPAANVTAIYNLSAATGPFQPTLSAAPADWAITIQYPPQIIVSLSPASATIPQSSQQGLTASVSGATAASYRWTTSATAGRLNEVGGLSQSAQTTYCSTSTQATYVPSASPALTANAVDSVTVQAFSGSGCIAANYLGSATAVSVNITPITASSILPGFAGNTFVSTVILPTGSNLRPEQLTVVDGVTQTTPAPSGTFTISTYAFGSQLALVESPAGSPMLLGWLDATHSSISAGTTAEVLAYYALGGPFMFTESDRNALEAAILTAPGLPALTQAVSNEIANNPDALAQTNAHLKAALDNFFTSVSGITPQYERGSSIPAVGVRPNAGSGGGGSGSGTGILVTPGSQSGLDIETLPPAQADVTNSYRRRTHAFVQRISDTSTGGSILPDPADVTDFEVAPVTGLTGGVAGTLSDIYNAYWGNTTTAYGPTTSNPFPIPLVSSYAKTTYHVTIVGPGKNTALFSSLTSAQANAQLQVAVGGFVTDALIPFLSNFVFGSGFPPGAGSASSTITVQAFQATWKADLQNDFLNALSTAPGIQTAIMQGDYQSALASVIDSIRQGGTFRNVLITSVQQAAGANWVPSSMTAALQVFNQLLNAAGGVLQIFDSSVYAAQLKASDAADQWTIVTGGQKITLTPASTNLSQFGLGLQILTAAAPGADTTGFSYFWSNTGLAGDISPLTGNGGSNSGFCSSSNQIQYVARSTPILAASITDTINVQAFSSGNCTAASSLGTAPPAAITISPDGVTISPASSTISQTGQAALTAAVNGSTGTTFSYLWVLSSPLSATPAGILNEVGGAGQSGLTFCSTSTQANYVPNSSPVLTANATDAVTVQAFSGTGCASGKSVGKSQPAGITVTAAGLLLTPRNASVSQNSQQSFAVTLTVAASGTTYTFQWTLTAQGGGTAVGSLQEINGAGQSGASFCSASKQANYVPNALPVLSSPSKDILTVQAFSGTGCMTADAVSGAVSTLVTVTPSPIVASIPLANEVLGILQASDGNYYASSQPNFLADLVTGPPHNGTCASQPVQTYYPCGTIYQITRGGSQNSIFNFPNSGEDGFQPGPMLEGPDGNLYGITMDGVFFRVSLAGKFTALNTGVFGAPGFPNANQYSTAGFPLILGSDGYFYTYFTSSIYRLSLNGEITVAYTLQPYLQTCSDGGGGTYTASPVVINSLIEGADGNFYGSLTGQCNGNATEGGSIFQLTRGGSLAKFAAFPPGYITPGEIVQTLDGSFYTLDYDVLRITDSGQVSLAYTPPTQPYGAAQITPNPIGSGLTLGSDGNFYGSTEALGYFTGPTSGASFDPSCSVVSGTSPDGTNYIAGVSGCSKFFQLSPAGGFSVLHTFAGGTDGVYANRHVNSNLPAETEIQNNNGHFIGATEAFPTPSSPNLKATLFDIDNHLPPPIQLSFSSTNPRAGSPVTITWNVLNAFSLTAQQCYAFVQNGVAAAGTWTGKQTGIVNGSTYTGSATITPTTPGTYTYALTCGGRESGFATLAVQ